MLVQGLERYSIVRDLDLLEGIQMRNLAKGIPNEVGLQHG
jgi:hypothetical protein